VFAATRSRCGGLAFAAALLCACAAPAWGAVPSGYGVQRVDDAPFPDRSLGAQLANIGDVNGDARDDLAIGNPAADGGRGEVVVVSGVDGSTIWRSPVPGGAAEVSDANLRFGSRVAKLGDVAGCGQQHAAGVDCAARAHADGVPEILVSALGGDVGVAAPDQGRVYVLDGRTGAVHRRLRLSGDDLPSTGGSAEFGYAIASAGDLDNDGEPEAVVGAPGYDETFDTVAPDCNFDGSGSGSCEESGRVYLFPSSQLGGPAPSGQPGSDFFLADPFLHNPVPQEDASQPLSRESGSERPSRHSAAVF
jgi:hypothetical protein